MDQAQSEVTTIARRLAANYPVTCASDYAVERKSITDDMTGRYTINLTLVLRLTALVLVINCANLANLTVARVTPRYQEQAIHEALDAAPARITQPLLAENLPY